VKIAKKHNELVPQLIFFHLHPKCVAGFQMDLALNTDESHWYQCSLVSSQLFAFSVHLICIWQWTIILLLPCYMFTVVHFREETWVKMVHWC